MDDAAADDEPMQLSTTPFLVALVLFAIVAVWAWSALRSDAALSVLRIDGFDVVDDTTFRAAGQTDQDTCAGLDRVQVDFGEEQIFAEMVIRPLENCDGPSSFVATVTLPQAIGERTLVAGAGRLQVPCMPASGDEWICGGR